MCGYNCNKPRANQYKFTAEILLDIESYRPLKPVCVQKKKQKKFHSAVN